MRGVLRCVPKPLCKASTNAAGVVAETTSFPEAGPFAVRERSFPKSNPAEEGPALCRRL